MSVLRLLGLDVKRANKLIEELRELVALAKPVVAKAHRIAEIVLEEDDGREE